MAEMLDDLLTDNTLFIRQTDNELRVYGTSPGAQELHNNPQNQQAQFLALKGHYIEPRTQHL
jgi:hypothetical protein